MKLKHSCALLLLSILTMTAARAELEDFLDLKAEILLTENKLLSRDEVALSALHFSEAKAASETSGFRAEQTLTAQGQYAMQLADFPANSTAILIQKQMQNAVKNHGYKIAFQCAAQVCGELEGYRAWLHPRLAGTVDSQRYLVAQKGNDVLAFYVADLGPRPRAALLQWRSPGHKAAPALVSFKSGSATLDERAITIIAELAKKIEKVGGRYMVVGHTDGSGSLTRNLTLAQERAKAVRGHLIDFHHIAAERLDTHVSGPLSRPLNGPQGRFVELLPIGQADSEVRVSATTAPPRTE